MTVRANYMPGFARRFLFISIPCFAFALWCAYDGFVAYPHHLERALEFEKLDDSDDAQRMNRWREIAAEKGWSPKRPGLSEEVQVSIHRQYLYGVLALAVAIPTLVFYLRLRGSWVEMSDTGFQTSWKQSLDFDSIQSLDKTKWQKKGIAKVHHLAGNRKKVFVLDDFKYEPKAIEPMLRAVEDRLGDEQITGGQREPDKSQTESDDSEYETTSDVEVESKSDEPQT